MGSIFTNLEHVIRSRDPAREERRVRRDLVDLISHATADDRTHRVRVINVSPLGLMCRTEANLLVGEKLTVWLPLLKDTPVEVRWVENGRVGMEFLARIVPKSYNAMLVLMPPRQTEW